ncbi:MAG: hypothetical protein ABSD63_18565 [Candidatus Korobacteraceae bacterium]|jgi:hypothetical protein
MRCTVDGGAIFIDEKTISPADIGGPVWALMGIPVKVNTNSGGKPNGVSERR